MALAANGMAQAFEEHWLGKRRPEHGELQWPTSRGPKDDYTFVANELVHYTGTNFLPTGGRAVIRLPQRIVLAIAMLVPASSLLADEKADLRQQQDQQRHVQQETDRAVRRMQTVLRVLTYHELDAETQKKLLGELAGTLSGLSKEQMAEIIERLGAAAKAPDEASARQEADVAYAKHREVLDALQSLLARQQLIKSLDQAADKLEKASKEQFDLALRSGEQAPARFDLFRRRTPASRRQQIEQADRQLDLQRDVANTFSQLDGVRDRLTPEQQDRLRRAEALAHEKKLDAEMKAAAEQLRQGKPQDAVAAQRKAAGDLQELARALRGRQDRLEALLEAKAKLDAAAREQERLREESHGQLDPKQHDLGRGENQEDRNKLQDAGHRQAAVELDTRDGRSVLTPHAKDLADKLIPAEKAMRDAQQAIRDGNANKTNQAQTRAAETLDKVRKELDGLLADAERKLGDPLAALQDAKEEINRLIEEQQSVRQDTIAAEAAKQRDRMPDLADRERELLERAENLRQQPMPSGPQAQAALEKAANAMRGAADDLKDQEGVKAVLQQEKALQALQEAKQRLQEQAAAIQKRRDDIAALADAQEKLEELATREGKLEQEAREKNADGRPADAERAGRQLAKEQGQIAEQAGKLQKRLESASPQSARTLEASQQNMRAAQEQLSKPSFQEGAEQAALATEKLKEAQQAVQQALTQKQAQEAADQAATLPEQMRLANAAQQVAKALEQAQEAAQQSGKAAERAGDQEAGEAARQSQAANQKAMAALQQAQAQSPQTVRPSLGQAEGRLQEAGERLQQAQPAQANQAQRQAVNQLQSALNTLNQALQASGQEQAQPGQKPTAQASRQQPGQNAGEQQASNQGQERNDDRGKGDRTPDGQLGNADSKVVDAVGGGSFIHLPPRQRELIRQALSEKLPPEYASFIQQYYVNVSKGKPATGQDKK